jgi:hypothetical protein
VDKNRNSALGGKPDRKLSWKSRSEKKKKKKKTSPSPGQCHDLRHIWKRGLISIVDELGMR